MAPAELDALPASAVIVLAQADKQYRVLAERLNPIPKLGSLPPAMRRRVQPHQPALVAPKAHVGAPMLPVADGPAPVLPVAAPVADEGAAPLTAPAAVPEARRDGDSGFF